MGKIYTRSDRKGAKTIPFGVSGGGTYLYSLHKGVPPPPARDTVNSLYCVLITASPGVYFRQTSVVYFGWNLAAVRIIGVSARRELIVADGDAALVIDDNVAKKYDDNKYDAAFSIILVAVK